MPFLDSSSDSSSDFSIQHKISVGIGYFFKKKWDLGPLSPLTVAEKKTGENVYVEIAKTCSY